MATLGVVIPTKNSRPLLPRHLEAMAKWIDLAAEVVVVDSFSEDGTVDFLRGQLKHPGLRVLTHPPGLYESWNFGLRSLTTDFAYVSTVGDTLTREGLLHLCETMTRLSADVVLSRPTLVTDGGRPMGEWPLPLDLILQDHAEAGPFRLKPAEMAIYAVVFSDGGMLGSSASNLYRTAFMQAHPFPVDHGPAGDGVWAAMHAFDATWAVTPMRFSTFMMHAPSHSQPRKEVRLDQTLREAVERVLAEPRAEAGWVRSAGLLDAINTTTAYLQTKGEFDARREASWPWFLNPGAWRVRQRRQRLRSALNLWKEEALLGLKS
ncbi:MAG: glycosyltransferase [Verrucomicrobia bacterium]|jgi:hypothetical protein|nr:glycosyltransferase [Verrucomicrobiota bacterium]